MKPPSAEEIATMFENVLSGRCTREDADHWATQWVAMADPPDMPDAHWEALEQLCGCELKHGPDAPYLHSNEQIADWFREFQANER